MDKRKLEELINTIEPAFDGTGERNMGPEGAHRQPTYGTELTS